MFGWNQVTPHAAIDWLMHVPIELVRNGGFTVISINLIVALMLQLCLNFLGQQGPSEKSKRDKGEAVHFLVGS